MKGRLLVSTAIGLVALPTGGMAAPPSSSWTGAYIGAFAGYGWTSSGSVGCNFALVGFSPSPCVGVGGGGGAPNVNARGFLGGLEAGYNWQVSNWVFGLEADLATMSMKGNSIFPSADQGYYPSAQLSSRYDWLGTARGRGGILFHNTLVYATGGFAYARVDQQYFDSFNGAFGARGWRGGWVLGGGLEHALSPQWSLKGEYLYINLQSTQFNAPLPNVSTFTFTNDFNIVRLGLNYRF